MQYYIREYQYVGDNKYTVQSCIPEQSANEEIKVYIKISSGTPGAVYNNPQYSIVEDLKQNKFKELCIRKEWKF